MAMYILVALPGGEHGGAPPGGGLARRHCD